MNGNHIFARLNDTALMVSLDQASMVESCLRGLAGHEHGDKLTRDQMGSSDDGFWFASDDWRSDYRPYVVKGGILQIPVFGVLLNRFTFQVGRYATGYTYIQKALERGLGDEDVTGIAFICDTPGGEVAGCFELQDKIYAARGQKPLRAFAAESAYSAGYAIASATDSIVTTRTGGVGSVGVVTLHVDYSKSLDAAGIKLTYIFAGDHKVDGNPYQPLPDAVKARIQKRIDKSYDVFTGLVARNRAMSVEDVVATQADCFTSDDAVEVGFADKVQVFEEALEDFTSNPDDTDVEDEDTMSTYTQAQMDAAIEKANNEAAAKNAAAITEAANAATAAATAAAGKAAKDRILAITGSDEGKKRPKAAHSAAMNTDMSAEAAVAFLKDLPEEQATAVAPPAAAATPAGSAAAATSHFDAAMAAGNVPIEDGAVDDGKGGTRATSSVAARVIANYNADRGVAPKK